MPVTPSFKFAVDDMFVHLRNIKNEMNSETQNASRYRTRKENRDKQNRDSTKDKELTIMKMDHNEFDCIKDNSSSLAPGTGWLESNNAFKPTFSRRSSKSAFKPTFSSL